MPETALDSPINSLDEAEQSFVGKIREHGWFRTSIISDDEGPGFSFTTGMWVSAQQPEFVIFSMKNEIAHNVFWDLFRDANNGKALETGRRLSDVFGNASAYAFPVAKRHYASYLGWSCWFYGGENFPCLQIVWPDRAGLFPWELGFDRSFIGDQPDLSENGWIEAICN